MLNWVVISYSLILLLNELINQQKVILYSPLRCPTNLIGQWVPSWVNHPFALFIESRGLDLTAICALSRTPRVYKTAWFLLKWYFSWRGLRLPMIRSYKIVQQLGAPCNIFIFLPQFISPQNNLFQWDYRAPSKNNPKLRTPRFFRRLNSI